MISAKEKKLLLEHLSKTPIIEIACKQAGVSRATYYRLRNKSVDFRKAADSAMAEGILLINDMSEAQVISLIKEKNWSAISFWLKSHHHSYSDKVEISRRITGSLGELSPEEEKIIAEAMRLASGGAIKKQRL
ncbi:MAG: hypothetical protein WC499_01870 [Patescibacteria group bacterium]